MMKSCAPLLLLMASGLVQAESMRCGSSLVSVGDRAFEVQERCGEPRYRDLVAYQLGEYDRRESKIEEWVYGPTNGMLYILTFEANRLRSIETRRDR